MKVCISKIHILELDKSTLMFKLKENIIGGRNVILFCFLSHGHLHVHLLIEWVDLKISTLSEFSPAPHRQKATSSSYVRCCLSRRSTMLTHTMYPKSLRFLSLWSSSPKQSSISRSPISMKSDQDFCYQNMDSDFFN